MLLVHYIRDVVGLTGSHVGCETSLCGACTVSINGQAVKSCTMLAVQADGAEITTIEGLAQNGELHPIQRRILGTPRLAVWFLYPRNDYGCPSVASAKSQSNGR